ncbi:MAG: hypothetical protein Q7U03_08930 [Syntrophales bacterium]|nr:hypothetical protein [Syntrophales bacterium]
MDAQLVQSASHPISTEEIKKQREKRDTPEGKLAKSVNLLKFSRDLESDWTVKNDKPQLSGARESHPRDTLFVGIFFRLWFFGLYPGQAINDKKNQRSNNGYR